MNIDYEYEWVSNSKCLEAYKLWIEYYYKCELFDRSVCSKTNQNGEVIPCTLEERILVNNNASINLLDLVRRAFVMEINDEALDFAKMKASKLSWNEIEKEYKRLFENIKK